MSDGARAEWAELVTTALLGTDRRDPPSATPGGLADLAADHPQPTPSTRLLQQVAATAVVLRAAAMAGPPAARVAPPPPDPRPVTPPGATTTWYRLVADWPVLEDEWVLAVLRHGLRVAPELVVPLLARHRTDAVRHARVLAAAGPLGEWMIAWSPRLACTARVRGGPEEQEALAELPPLAIVPELLPLLAEPPPGGHQAHAVAVATELAGGLSSGRFQVSARAVLVNVCARVHPSVLPTLAVALRRVDPTRATIGIAFALADLAELRHHLLTELEPA